MRVASPSRSFAIVSRKPLPSARATQRLLRLFLAMPLDGQDALLEIAEQLVTPSQGGTSVSRAALLVPREADPSALRLIAGPKAC